MGKLHFCSALLAMALAGWHGMATYFPSLPHHFLPLSHPSQVELFGAEPVTMPAPHLEMEALPAVLPMCNLIPWNYLCLLQGSSTPQNSSTHQPLLSLLSPLILSLLSQDGDYSIGLFISYLFLYLL